MSAHGLLPDRKGTAECKLCERRRPRAELSQGGGHNNYRCVDRKACEARVLASCGWDATEERITRKAHSRDERREKEQS